MDILLGLLCLIVSIGLIAMAYFGAKDGKLAIHVEGVRLSTTLNRASYPVAFWAFVLLYLLLGLVFMLLSLRGLSPSHYGLITDYFVYFLHG